MTVRDNDQFSIVVIRVLGLIWKYKTELYRARETEKERILNQAQSGNFTSAPARTKKGKKMWFAL